LLATYERFLATIPSEHQGNAIKLLNLLVGSSRYLSLVEINVAFTIRLDHETAAQIAEDMSFSIEPTFQGILGPLVRISGSKISLVHQSAKVFLLDPALGHNQNSPIRAYAVEFTEASLVLAFSCINYLLLDEFFD